MNRLVCTRCLQFPLIQIIDSERAKMRCRCGIYTEEITKYLEKLNKINQDKHECEYDSHVSDEQAIVYCLNCQKWLCVDCLEFHEAINQNHQFGGVEEESMFCNHYKKKDFNYFCYDCLKNYCYQCSFYHDNHRKINFYELRDLIIFSFAIDWDSLEKSLYKENNKQTCIFEYDKEVQEIFFRKKKVNSLHELYLYFFQSYKQYDFISIFNLLVNTNHNICPFKIYIKENVFETIQNKNTFRSLDCLEMIPIVKKCFSKTPSYNTYLIDILNQEHVLYGNRNFFGIFNIVYDIHKDVIETSKSSFNFSYGENLHWSSDYQSRLIVLDTLNFLVRIINFCVLPNECEYVGKIRTDSKEIFLLNDYSGDFCISNRKSLFFYKTVSPLKPFKIVKIDIFDSDFFLNTLFESKNAKIFVGMGYTFENIKSSKVFIIRKENYTVETVINFTDFPFIGSLSRDSLELKNDLLLIPTQEKFFVIDTFEFKIVQQISSPFGISSLERRHLDEKKILYSAQGINFLLDLELKKIRALENDDKTSFFKLFDNSEREEPNRNVKNFNALFPLEEEKFYQISNGGIFLFQMKKNYTSFFK